MTSDDLIELIVGKANYSHVNNQNPPGITYRDVLRIVNIDFEMADDLMVLDIDQLKEIYSRYYVDLSKVFDISRREKALKNYILGFLRKYQSRLD